MITLASFQVSVLCKLVRSSIDLSRMGVQGLRKLHCLRVHFYSDKGTGGVSDQGSLYMGGIRAQQNLSFHSPVN